MAQEGDIYANDYSANYATGSEMIDLNARRRAALAEVQFTPFFFPHSNTYE